jgi:hypothetical protein
MHKDERQGETALKMQAVEDERHAENGGVQVGRCGTRQVNEGSGDWLVYNS